MKLHEFWHVLSDDSEDEYLRTNDVLAKVTIDLDHIMAFGEICETNKDDKVSETVCKIFDDCGGIFTIKYSYYDFKRLFNEK